MTKEEKELLLKDLCARLPHGVMAHFDYENIGKSDKEVCVIKRCYNVEGELNILVCGNDNIGFLIEHVKPYLRPMSSMTEEEKKEFIHHASYEIEESVNGRHYEYYLKDYVGTPEEPTCNPDAIDWLNARHFDYRGLIKKGLALEAPDGMYNN